MKVFIIGAGNVGGGQVRSAIKAGHQVSVYAEATEKFAKFISETGATRASSIAEGASSADVVYLAVPFGSVGSIAEKLKPVIGTSVLIDGTNPLNATYSDLEYKTQSGAADLQAQLPNAFVVKALNTVFAGRYSNPYQHGAPLQVLIAGDHELANKTVETYAKSLGFDPVIVGGLRFARSLEEMAFLNISLNASNGFTWQSAWTLTGPDGLK